MGREISPIATNVYIIFEDIRVVCESLNMFTNFMAIDKAESKNSHSIYSERHKPTRKQTKLKPLKLTHTTVRRFKCNHAFHIFKPC